MTTQTISTRARPGIYDSLSAFGAMVRKELIIWLRYPVEFFASFFQVFIILVIFSFAGLMFAPGGVSGGMAGNEVSAAMPYGFILFLFLESTLWNIGYNVRREQKQGTLEHLYMSPASKFASLVSRVVITLISTGLLTFGTLTVFYFAFGLPLANVPLALLILVFTLSGTFGIGFAFAALTLFIKETAQTLAGFSQFAFIVLCAPFFPFAALPEPVQWLARAIPLSYGVDAFRSALTDFPAGYPELLPLNVELAIIIGFGVLMPVVGYLLYRRAENVVRERGTLSEY